MKNLPMALPKTTHIIFFSGGASSYLAAKRVIEKYGKQNVKLLFTDTNAEEPLLYKFLIEARKKLDVPLIYLDNDGKDIWDIAFEDKMLFNSKIANCTKRLKIRSADKFIRSNFSPESTVLHLGLDWGETNRHQAPRLNWYPYRVEYIMNEAPLLFKEDYLKEIERDGLPILESYKMGFEHGNCSGFCFKAGIGHFVHLLKTKPDYYFYNAEKERQLQEVIYNHRKEVLPTRINKETDRKKRKKLIKTFNSLDRKTVTILTRKINKRVVNISLYDLAALYKSGDIDTQKLHLRYRNKLNNKLSAPIEQPELTQSELFEFGGCGCFSTASAD